MGNTSILESKDEDVPQNPILMHKAPTMRGFAAEELGLTRVNEFDVMSEIAGKPCGNVGFCSQGLKLHRQTHPENPIPLNSGIYLTS